MIKNFDDVIKTISGEDMSLGIKDGKEVFITQKECLINALIANHEDERNLTGLEKMQRGDLAMRLSKGGDIDLSVEEVSLLKKVNDKFGSILVVYQITKNLETDYDPARN